MFSCSSSTALLTAGYLPLRVDRNEADFTYPAYFEDSVARAPVAAHTITPGYAEEEESDKRLKIMLAYSKIRIKVAEHGTKGTI